MPYIATDLDAFDAAQGVSGATGLPLQHVLGGLALLWRWCWRQKTDRVSGEHVAALFGSSAPGLLPALATFGFLESSGADHRVRGALRYLHITAVRAKAGKKRAENAKRLASGQLATSTAPARAGDSASTAPAADQQRTSPSATSDERRATSEQKGLAGVDRPLSGKDAADLFGAEGGNTSTVTHTRKRRGTAAARIAVEDPRVSGGDPTYKALVDEMFAVFLADRGFPLEPSGPDWKALQRLRGKHRGEEILRRWRLGVLARFKAKCSCFRDLEAKWNDCGAPEASRGAQVGRPEVLSVGGGREKVAEETEMWAAYRENLRNEEGNG